MVGVQALAMGLAVLASRVGGFLELVRDGENGFLLASGDQEGRMSGFFPGGGTSSPRFPVLISATQMP